MFSSLTIRGLSLKPARFCAPLAEITHSAFRRLLTDFGGCGAHFTEMLSGRKLLKEDLQRSPYSRRAPAEKRLFYQLMLRPDDPVDQIIDRLATVGPDAIDLNLACYAPVIRRLDACSQLFENLPSLIRVLRATRRAWPGPLTVKIRLGSAAAGNEARFVERLRAIEDSGVDAITLHTRFFEDKFKRRSRHELFAWATAQTRLPIIANGDILGEGTLTEHPAHFQSVAGIMIGRMAVARPWLFAAWNQQPVTIDHAEIWRRLHGYIAADFPENIALRRIRLFTKYYARNFHFGHTLDMAIQNAPSLEAMHARAGDFFATPQALFREPCLQGL
ncbi:MAG: tRNA-dihydrouridine synthase family protein [Verrucomicrobia bacterium]|nr:tRNA-dihydrouridine synthase family protein [Verrucomicrobiota bacterium]